MHLLSFKSSQKKSTTSSNNPRVFIFVKFWKGRKEELNWCAVIPQQRILVDCNDLKNFHFIPKWPHIFGEIAKRQNCFWCSQNVNEHFNLGFLITIQLSHHQGNHDDHHRQQHSVCGLLNSWTPTKLRWYEFESGNLDCWVVVEFFFFASKGTNSSFGWPIGSRRYCFYIKLSLYSLRLNLKYLSLLRSINV